MRLRYALLGLLFLQTASAFALTDSEKKAAKVGKVTPTLSSWYVRSAAEKDSSHYFSFAGLEITATYMNRDESSWLINALVGRDLDALEERYVWTATELTYGSRKYEILPKYEAKYSLTLVAPTNSDSREYLSYQGSFITSGSVERKIALTTWAKDFTYSFSVFGRRNFFEYDASKYGSANAIYVMGGSASFSLGLNDIFSLSGSYGQKKVRRANDSWRDSYYDYATEISATVNDHLSLSLSQGSDDNPAYSYDTTSLNFALYDYQKTVYTAKATYTF